jgi:hypothetical protein
MRHGYWRTTWQDERGLALGPMRSEVVGEGCVSSARPDSKGSRLHIREIRRPAASLRYAVAMRAML